MNQKNSLGLNNCFLELNDPVELFKVWMEEAKKTELNDPNALALATSDSNNSPSVRMVLLKDYDKNGFVFYTNLKSQKGNELEINPKASMCFHWKSLLRQIRINGTVKKVSNKIADTYYNSRDYESRIGAWASKQSSILKNRDELIKSIDEYRKKYENKDLVPRPEHWSGWNLNPSSIEFWLDGENRIHERLKYTKDKNGDWDKSLLSP
jgi:pyridoxamine 5'-phosphate oxidase